MFTNHLSGVLLAAALTWAAAAPAGEVRVRIEGAPKVGSVAFVLFDSADAFGDFRDPIRVERQTLDGRELYRLEDVAPGEYALLVYLDENANLRLDKNFIGIPREPLAFSNGYSPKGPPSYRRAAFELTESEPREFNVTLRRPLGERGRIGVGVGAIVRSSPYRNYNGSVYQFIPAITYIGDRLQIFGPNLQLGLTGQGPVRLAATGQYSIGAYEESESDFLRGMGDRESTFMAGLALRGELPGGVDLSAGYEHDLLDRIGGGTARLAIDRSFQAGRLRYAPQLGLNWMSRKLAQYDFGVPAAVATAERPAYRLNDALSLEVGLGLFVDLSRDWLITVNSSVEFLDARVTDSPIVSNDHLFKSFAAVSYVF